VSLEYAYNVFKEIEAEMYAPQENDPELYAGLASIRKELKAAMEVRAQELGKADSWAIAMKLHDAKLLLQPLFRAQDDNTGRAYIKAFRSLTPEQLSALDWCEKKVGMQLTRPELLEAELRWVEIRLATLLRFIPAPEIERTRTERTKAVLLAVALVSGFVFALHTRSLLAAAFVLALVFIIAITWVRDFISYLRRKRALSRQW